MSYTHGVSSSSLLRGTMELKINEKFEIKGRGPVFTFDIDENGLPEVYSDLKLALVGKRVTIEGTLYDVIGIDSASLTSLAPRKGAIMVKIAL
jgi:hypothetical protein